MADYKIPDDLKYTKDHEWVKVDGTTVTTGITDYAQKELSDIIYVELPDLNAEVEQFSPYGSIEAVKTVADLFAPVSGTVIEVNDALRDDPGLINRDPYGEGWIIKIKMSNPDELNNLLTPEEYEELIGGEEE
jgi:glycine cleavage system H protein